MKFKSILNILKGHQVEIRYETYNFNKKINDFTNLETYNNDFINTTISKENENKYKFLFDYDILEIWSDIVKLNSNETNIIIELGKFKNQYYRNKFKKLHNF